MTSYRDDKITPTTEANERGKDGECLLSAIFIMTYKIPHYIYIKLYPLSAEQLGLQHHQVNLP